jgi:hypothetical protein
MCLAFYTPPPVPPELAALTAVEERMISPRIPFMHIRELRYDGQLGIKGNVVNVPLNVQETVTVLPRRFTQMQTIQVELMRQMSTNIRWVYETVRPYVILMALRHLMTLDLFRDEAIVENDVWLSQFPNPGPNDVVNFIVNDQDQEEAVRLEREQQQQQQEEPMEVDPPLQADVAAAPIVDIAAGAPESDSEAYDSDATEPDISEDERDIEGWDALPGENDQQRDMNHNVIDEEETLLQDMNDFNQALDQNEAIRYAPAENNRPIGVLHDNDAEFLSFPVDFAGQKPVLPERLTYAAWCKYLIRHKVRRFSTNVTHLFFMLMKLMTVKVVSSINVAMRQRTGAGPLLQINAAVRFFATTVKLKI